MPPWPASMFPIEVPASTRKSPVKASAETLPTLEADETTSIASPSTSMVAMPVTLLVLVNDPA